MKPDPQFERYQKAAAKETICFSFKANPKQVEAKMVEEFIAGGWTHDKMDAGSDNFFRGEIGNSTYKGTPTDEIGSVTDFATFISEHSMLEVPSDVNCVVILTRKTNFAELLQRLKQKPKPVDGSE